MGQRSEPWQTAEIAGPKKALLILKPDVVVALVKRAKRPLLVVGHLTAEAEADAKSEYNGVLDTVVRLSKATKMPVVATAHTIKAFLQRDFQPAASMSAMDIGNRLQDDSWTGLDGLGPPDLAMFLGLPYYMAFVLLSALKHFAPQLTTVSLDRYYTPHATWAFPNLKIAEWRENVEIILSKFEET